MPKENNDFTLQSHPEKTWEKVGNKFALLKKRIEEEIVPGKTFDHQLAQMKKSNVKGS